MGTWHDPDLGRPIAAPLERCAELLGVDLATARDLAAKVEPYLRADGTRIWSVTQLEQQLRPEAYGRRRGGYLDRRQTSAVGHSQSGMPQAPLGYESFEDHSTGCSPVPNRPNYRGVGCFPTGSRPARF